MLRAKSAIGVEGQEFYRSAFEKTQSQNSHIDCKFTRYFKLIHPKKTADGITFGEIANRHGIEKFDFVKCDIEGGEFPSFLEEPGNLEYFDNFSMETHNDMGSIDSLVQAFQNAGFTLSITDQFGNRVAPDQSHYISGSRTGDLKD